MSENKSSAKTLGELLSQEIQNNPDFFLFSPDETSSNRLNKAYESSDRLWLRNIKPYEKNLGPKGQIIEILSENTLFSLLQGHVLSGKPGLITSYEAFFSVITSQLEQYLKFLKQSSEVSWRKPVTALNLFSTSTCWRQDHNGFSHQNPSIITTLLTKPSNHANCLFPIDSTAMIAAWRFANYDSKNVVNLITANKTEEPQFINESHANYELQNGASIHQYISDEDPEIILTAAGDLVSRESIYALKILKQDSPEIKTSFVGISALSYNAIGTTNHKLSNQKFHELFPENTTIISNFQGYPETLKTILNSYTDRHIFAHGFIEQGSTTTPFDMLARNKSSRYDLLLTILEVAKSKNLISSEKYNTLAQKYQKILTDNIESAKTTGLDIAEITNFVL